MILEAIVQLASGAAACGGVITNNYVISRLLRAAALATIALDFTIKIAISGAEPAYIIGIAMYSIPTVRTLLILWVPAFDREWRWRLVVCAIAGISQLSIAIPVAWGHLDLITVLPITAIVLASVGDTSNNMPVRRRYILVIGCIIALFAIETEAWGLLAKALISDVGASLWAIVPWRAPRRLSP
jgi:hypothetical protein